MISKTYPSKRSTIYQQFKQIGYALSNSSPFVVHQARKRGCSVEEYTRREEIIKKLASDCGFQHGDTAYPKDAADYEQFGVVMIVGVVRSYKDMENDHIWADDHPMILSFRPRNDTTCVMNCTTGYLTKTNQHLCPV